MRRARPFNDVGASSDGGNRRTLGQWFQDVGNVVRRAGGTIDKFVGDGVLAYWTRESEEGHESRGALDSALSLLKAADRHR
jgi:class 3 adenylate cyclase